MAPDKTDPESGEDTPNTSTVSENNTSITHETEREPYFEPVVHLPVVKVKTNEEDESELLRLRCKLFRFYNLETPPEWKERGTGDVKILHHLEKNTVRIIMRQDKTLKIRANHFITPFMELKPNCNSDRAFVWQSRADFADEEIKQETFAIRFANVDHAKLFKDKFDEARGIASISIVSAKDKTDKENCSEEEVSTKSTNTKDGQSEDDVSEEVTKDLGNLSVSEKETVSAQ